MRCTLFASDLGDVPANLAFTNNFTATTDPTVNNDGTQGYQPGSTWINKTAKKSFLMISNATGAAVWQLDNEATGEISQGAPGALNATGTLTAALMAGGIVTTTSAAAVVATLDLGTAMDTAFPNFENNDAFDFSVINTGSNPFTVTTSTGWGSLAAGGAMAVANGTSGRFRARKTGAGTWTMYRLS